MLQTIPSWLPRMPRSMRSRTEPHRFTLREKSAAGPVYTSVSSGPPDRLSKQLDALSRRDFIYLVFVLSLFGKAAWFLALTAVGAPVFLILVLVLAAKKRRAVPSA